MIVSFTASRVVPSSQLTNSDCLDWPGTNSYRCDDPIDQSGSGGLPVPKVLNSYALLNAQVQVNGNVLRQYQFSYQQGHSAGDAHQQLQPIGLVAQERQRAMLPVVAHLLYRLH